ncbi:hypothetical protein DM992_30905 [Burkholderia sp. JP2-270]|uniref:hypothetical protein n=1 Tax=Burkholderia sp. JP2-270 TaxID=2217913 RepID=UPI000DA39693|nr:hypothetical protein [Burkholderia sp. JP2-270]AWV03622.1 hypothetical protein DM992_30905 [Burkholderia sp. JP2-270]
MGKPDLRRPVAGPYRQSRWAAVLEAAFGWVAKGTMVLAGLAMVAVMALTGDLGGLTDLLPTTRKDWLYLLLILVVAVALIFAVRHYWLPPGSARPAG